MDLIVCIHIAVFVSVNKSFRFDYEILNQKHRWIRNDKVFDTAIYVDNNSLAQRAQHLTYPV